MFLIDIIITFNTAIVNDDFEVIHDRNAIACHYLKGWFLLDTTCIIPFDLFVSLGNSSNASNVLRMARIGRINKILKLMKLIRLTKMQKKTS